MVEVFDFDGTLIDLWPRYYRVFCDAAEIDDSIVKFDKYKEFKRNHPMDNNLAEELGIELPENYYKRKQILLEDERYLELDKDFVDTDTFSSYFNDRRSILLTKRRRPEALKSELSRLGFYLDERNVIILNPADLSKEQWIQKNYPDEDVVLIGDGKEEIEAAEYLGNVDLYLVNTGLMKAAKGTYNIHPIDNVDEYLRQSRNR